MSHGCRIILHLAVTCCLLGSYRVSVGQALQRPAIPTGRHDDAALKFDVVSIHESDPSVPVRQHFYNPIHAGSLDAVMRLSQLVSEAFGVNFRYQLSGGPDWLDRENFSVHASSDEQADHRLAALPDDEARTEKRRMLLQVLQERFGLRYHLEDRPGLTYFLTSQKAASSLLSETEPSASSGISSGGASTDLVLTGHGAKMSQFVGLMSYYLKAPVVDQTHLSAAYNFKVHFNASRDPSTADAESGPSPEEALSDQMGLKLVRGKAPVQTVVIDSVTKPTPN